MMPPFNVYYSVEDPQGLYRQGIMPVSADSTMAARSWMFEMLIRYIPTPRFAITGVEELPSSSDELATADPLRRESEH